LTGLTVRGETMSERTTFFGTVSIIRWSRVLHVSRKPAPWSRSLIIVALLSHSYKRRPLLEETLNEVDCQFHLNIRPVRPHQRRQQCYQSVFHQLCCFSRLLPDPRLLESPMMDAAHRMAISGKPDRIHLVKASIGEILKSEIEIRTWRGDTKRATL
jgi:hypothetical protein